MRKSLGNKRNEIGREQIDEIVRIYGDFTEGPYCKIFDNEDFGYRRITVERPLHLRYELTEVNLAAILENKAVQKFLAPTTGSMRLAGMGDGEGMRTDLVAALRAAASTPTTDANALAKALDKALAYAGLNPPPAVRKALVDGLAVRDESAPVVRDKKGHPLPDPELRDSEDVPLKEDVNTFFEREVTPHVPDAWINRSALDPKDGQVGKVGYEINFNRYFYRYQPPRPLEEIEAEIKVLEQEIVQMLREVTA
jgi:type I restriction enzyme M protein